MKVISSRKLEEKYFANPVESPERIVLPRQELEMLGYEFIEPSPASLEDIHRVHGWEHIEIVWKRGLYEVAALAAGGAVCAAELALRGNPAFALVRPPGHHAAANRAWGMCYFNNIQSLVG